MALAALVVAAPVPVAAAEVITTPDSTGDVGLFPSLVLDAAGNPVVAYNDASNGDLKLLHCIDPTCSPGGAHSITVPDSVGNVGRGPSLALDAAGRPVVSYDDSTNAALKVLRCADTSCSTGGGHTITSHDAGSVHGYSSIALTPLGVPIISFNLSGSVAVLYCSTFCERTNPASDGLFTSLALDAGARPIISHYDVFDGDLKVLRCADSRCHPFGGEHIHTTPDAAGDVGAFSSLKLDASGNPAIAYHDATNGDLKVLRCADPSCTAGMGTITVADADLPTGGYISLSLDAADNPVISYYDAAMQRLKLMRCGDRVCTPSESTISVPDTSGDVGQYNSLALDAAGNPVIAYYDATNGDLKVLHCDDPACRSDLAPTADAGGPYSAVQGEQVDLGGLGADPDGGGIELAWDLDGDGMYDDATSEVVPLDTAGHAVGEHTLGLRVTDDEGASAVDTALLTITAAEPGDGDGDGDGDGAGEPEGVIDFLPQEPVMQAVCWARYATRAAEVGDCLAAGSASPPATTGSGDGPTPHVLLARADAFPDALASGVAQGAFGAPLLLSAGDTLDARTREELGRLGAQRVTLLGGSAALSPAVESQLQAAGYTTDRLAGASRLETAIAIARVAAPDATTALLARAFGTDGDQSRAFADSLAAGAWAAETGWPLLLTETARLSASSAAHLQQAGITAVTIVGGDAAVGPQVVADLQQLGIEVDRVAGGDRAATAAAVADARGLGAGAAGTAILIEGFTLSAWVDGFAAALSASRDGAPVLLADRDAIPPATGSWLSTDVRTLVCAPATTDTACAAATTQVRTPS